MLVQVKVIPRARVTEFAGSLEDGTVKIKVAAVPENGRANEELCRFLAAHYGVPQRSVAIVAGHASTRKRVEITGASGPAPSLPGPGPAAASS